MRAIDIHAHVTPQCFYRAVDAGQEWHGNRLEKDKSGTDYHIIGTHRQKIPAKARWGPEQRLADMDSLGVNVHILSTTPTLYGYDLDPKVTIAMNKECNDEVAQTAKSWPDRFSGFATLPMQDVKAAIAELERSVIKLGLKGAMIDDHVNGLTYDEPQFLPFWKAAEQMGALIFIHQIGGYTVVTHRTKRYFLGNTIGNLADRAITYATLVFGGVMDKCPDLNVCLAHGGGYVCYGIGRMDRGWQVIPDARANISLPPSAYLKRFYYDCLTHSEPALRFLIDTVGVERVVFGTDWPADMAIDWPVSWVLSLKSLTKKEKELILWKNVEKLLDLQKS